MGYKILSYIPFDTVVPVSILFILILHALRQRVVIARLKDPSVWSQKADRIEYSWYLAVYGDELGWEIVVWVFIEYIVCPLWIGNVDAGFPVFVFCASRHVGAVKEYCDIALILTLVR